MTKPARGPHAPPPPEDGSRRDQRERKAPAEPKPAADEEPKTRITPVDRKVGEERDNLRDRASAFNRRRGGK
ncbi:MAG: hypothetical protein ABI812_08620 [Betaproteobacteria bacterium]